MEEKEKLKIEEIADRTAQKILDIVGRPGPIKRIRSSQILTAVLGTAGLALFIVGIEKFFVKYSAIDTLILGILIMIVAGVLIQRLSE